MWQKMCKKFLFLDFTVENPRTSVSAPFFPAGSHPGGLSQGVPGNQSFPVTQA